MIIVLTLLLAYLIGSIPFGLLLAKLAGHGDIRSIGSGNIGATNVMRTGNKKLAALVLLLDGLKGFVAVVIAYHLINEQVNFYYVIPWVAGEISVLGHVFPIWLRFKGGKGVATAIGTTLALSPILGGLIITIWLITFLVFRISSLAALTAFLLATLINYVPSWISLLNHCSEFLANAEKIENSWDMFLFIFYPITLLPLVLLLFFTHRANIKRLINGTEPRFGAIK